MVKEAMLHLGWRGARRAYGLWQCPTIENRLKHLDSLCRNQRKNLQRHLTILEVGSLLGCSASTLARYGTVFCIDPWPWGMSEFGRRTKGMDIVACRGLSNDVLPRLRTGAFDLAYVDGDHTYPAIDNDLAECKRLVHEDGIICGDDLERQIGDDDLTLHEASVHRRSDCAAGYHAGVTCAVHQAFGRVCERDGVQSRRLP
jgi:predicted O-methyltransferase YrrM